MRFFLASTTICLLRLDVGAAALSAQTRQPTTEWLAARLQPLQIDAEGGAAGDAVLAALSREARVIGIGETAHHTREIQQLRLKLTQDLIVRHGFRGVAMETGYADALLLDRWLSDPSAPEPDLSKALPYSGDGRQQEMRVALRWLKAFNDGQPAASRVQFIGVDLSNGGGNLRPPFDQAWELLAPFDESFVRQWRARLSPVLYRFGSGYSSTAKQRFDSLSIEDRRALAAGATALRKHIVSHRADYERSNSSGSYETAIHSAEVAEQTLATLRLDPHDPQNPRDQALASNVIWAMHRLPKGAGLVVWAHNAHVQKQPIDVPLMKMKTPAISMGQILAGILGRRYAAIGTVISYLRPDSASADTASVDAHFAESGVPAYIVRLDDANARSTSSMWLAAPHPMRFEGIYLRVAPSKAFDALAYLQSAGPDQEQ